MSVQLMGYELEVYITLQLTTVVTCKLNGDSKIPIGVNVRVNV